MPLLTIFTAPKPFKDPHIITIQTNALNSWRSLGDDVDILVMGRDEGVAEACSRLSLSHFPETACNELGTPLISSMLAIARQNSDSPFLCIVNTDIILFPDLLDALRNTASQLREFLLLGQRWDMEITQPLPAEAAGFTALKQKVARLGKLHPPMGSDYFIFPRDCYHTIPDLTIGRAGWDNWFIFKSRWEGWRVVDATHDVTIIHQAHDYRHLPGGQPHYRLPETMQNVNAAGGEEAIFTIFDAEYALVDGQVQRKKWDLKKLAREIEIFPLTRLRSRWLGKLFYYLRRPRKAYQALYRLLKA